MVPRSHVLALVLVAAAVLSAGCLGAGPFGDGEEATPTLTPATVPTAEAPPQVTATATETPRETAISWEAPADEPDPSKQVILTNEWDRNVTVDVRVVRTATNETVHEGRYVVRPDERRRVYDTAAAEPDGIEPFTVAVSARNETRQVTIETNECYGAAYGAVSNDGDLEVYYAIC